MEITNIIDKLTDILNESKLDTVTNWKTLERGVEILGSN